MVLDDLSTERAHFTGTHVTLVESTWTPSFQSDIQSPATGIYCLRFCKGKLTFLRTITYPTLRKRKIIFPVTTKKGICDVSSLEGKFFAAKNHHENPPIKKGLGFLGSRNRRGKYVLSTCENPDAKHFNISPDIFLKTGVAAFGCSK